MDEKFWHQRWETNDIGFHKDDPHHDLVKYFNRLGLQRGDTIFVPLCGKSKDLVWLHARGMQVVGVELSRVAVEAFFAENDLQGEWTEKGGLSCCCSPGYTIYCADLYDIRPTHLNGAAAAYDRGSLVALPTEMREDYAGHINGLMPPASRILAVSYEYDQIETYGPPFSVPLEEVRDLFSPDFELEVLVEEDTLWSHQGLSARGVTQLTEFVVLLTKGS
jgi:thiopurine S-methyltransferase